MLAEKRISNWITLFILGILFFTYSNIQAQSIQLEPKLYLKESIINIGNIPIGKTHTIQIEITNSGKTDLIIKNIRATCGCTVPKWNKQAIKPNEKSTITIAFTPSKIGYFAKDITVFSNTPSKKTTITIYGTCIRIN